MNLKLILALSVLLMIQMANCQYQRYWGWDDSLNMGEEQTKQTFKRDTSSYEKDDDYLALESMGTAAHQYPNFGAQQNGTETTAEDVIEEILVSNRQGRNIDGLDDVYSDPVVKEALANGDDTQARNLIRDKLCELGLMQCDEPEGKRQYIYTQPPPGYNGPRPGPPPGYNGQRPQQGPQQGPQYRPQPPKGIYGPAQAMPIGLNPNQPPRKVGYYGPPKPNYVNAPPKQQQPGPIYDKFGSGDFFESDASSAYGTGVRFGYTEKPKIVINTPAAVTLPQSHVHHHYHHLDKDETKPVFINSPVPIPVRTSEHSSLSTLNSLASYSNAGFGTSGSGGFNPSSAEFDYKGVNSGSGATNGVYSPVKPVFESNNYAGQFQSGNQYSGASLANQGPAQFTDGSNVIYGQQQSQFGGNTPSNSYHANAPDFYKKELNVNGGKQNNFGQNSNQQYSQNNYNQGEQYQGFESARQESFDCVCVPYDQCAAHDVVGRRDDLILPLDPRNLGSTEIEAEDSNSTAIISKDAPSQNATEITTELPKKISKRAVDNKVDLKQADGEGRILGLLGGGNYGGNNGGNYGNYGGQVGGGIGGKKVIPTLGVSFGLPVPSNYPINPFGNPVAPNPFGGLNYNGLNLGLFNVNPLVSVQLTKTEHGEKLLKPLVNLHVTPNEHFIGKIGKGIGSLFASKQQSLHKHYHKHLHHGFEHGYASPFPYTEGPHNYNGPPHYPSGPHFEGPHHFPPSGFNHQEHFEPHFQGPHFPGPNFPGPNFPGPNFEPNYPPGAGFPTGPGFDGNAPPFGQYGPHFNGPHPPHYKDNGNQPDPNGNQYETNGPQQYPEDNYNPDIYSLRNFNASSIIDSQIKYQQQQLLDQNLDIYSKNDNSFNAPTDYANNFRNFDNAKNNPNTFTQSIPAQAPGVNRGSKTVTFPNSRRKRDTDQVVPGSIEVTRSVESHETLETANQKAGAVDDDTTEGRALNALKRQAFYQRPGQNQLQQQQKQCGPRAVCCRSKNYRPAQQKQPQQYGRCGTRHAQGINGRIKNPVYVDGDSEFGEYPWQAGVLKKDPKESVYVCGGTLIDDQHILTAAHCVKTYSGFDLRVRLGEFDVNHDVEFYPYIERDVISVSIHPEYYAGTLDNDMAILKLSQPVDFSTNPHISPACLPDKYTDFTGSRCWTTGWGKDAWGEFGKYQNILKEVDVPIIGDAQCQAQLRQTRLGYSYKLHPGFLCAGGEEGKDACKGDGGGPLVCERQGSWQVVGLVSWGIGCGQVNVPGVYVKVAYYLDWIQQITRRY